MSTPELEPVLKSIPEIIKQASQSELGIFALLIIVLFGLAFYFFRKAPVKWRAIIFFVFFAGVVAYGVEITRVANKPSAVHYVGQVLDKLTKDPIHKASVVVSLGPNVEPPYYTDSRGDFSFWLKRDKPSEDAGIRIHHEDYQDFDRIVSSDESSELGDISLVRLSAQASAPPAPAGGEPAQPAPAPAAPAGVASAGHLPAAVAIGKEKHQVKTLKQENVHVAIAPKPAVAMAAASVAAHKVVEVSSGQKISGNGKAWSNWYQLSVGPAPAGFAVEKSEFWLTGDRSCGAWAECKESKRGASGVMWEFRLQGHDEWGAPRQTYSEGHLRVTYRPG